MKRKFRYDIVDKLVEHEGIMGVNLGLYEEGSSSVKVGDIVYVALL